MKINELKLQFLNDKVQVVIFDEGGNLVETCNTLVKLDQKTSIFDQFTVLAALKDEVLRIQPDEPLYYPCLNNSFGELGYHDFHFSLHGTNDLNRTFLWYIHDLSTQYEKLVDLQQTRNETYLEKERLLEKNKELKIKSNILSKIDFESERHTFIKNDSMLLNFNTSELFYVEAYGDYVKLHTLNKTFLVYTTMKKVEEKLPIAEFVRVHRSFIVRIDKIVNIHLTNLEIMDRIIPISSLNKSKLMKKIDIL